MQDGFVLFAVTSVSTLFGAISRISCMNKQWLRLWSLTLAEVKVMHFKANTPLFTQAVGPLLSPPRSAPGPAYFARLPVLSSRSYAI